MKCVFCFILSHYLFSLLCSTTLDPYDTDQMAREFLFQYSGQAFTVGQQLAFSFFDKKLLGLVVKSLEGKNGCGT
jgi:vesicle-fusing ATPase